jgi:hypothetical protein
VGKVQESLKYVPYIGLTLVAVAVIGAFSLTVSAIIPCAAIAVILHLCGVDSGVIAEYARLALYVIPLTGAVLLPAGLLLCAVFGVTYEPRRRQL